MWVNALLQSQSLGNYEWHWDKPLYVDMFWGDGATKRCMDLVKNTIVAIDTDKNQHKGHAPDYEETRYNELVMEFIRRYIFLKVNPNLFIIAGVKQDPLFKERLKQVEQRLKVLLEAAALPLDESVGLV
eukprot:GHRR01007494.1.p1 GENE.GHRR01007494.1~~GHRR01007494.1.p1  ORF type:complete len:129 (+),score=13.37 GHRR01007494.1:1281-1667(+)